MSFAECRPVMYAVLLLIGLCGVAALLETLVAPKQSRKRYGRCRKRTRGTIFSIDTQDLARAANDYAWNINHKDQIARSSNVFVRYAYSVGEQTYEGSGSIPPHQANIGSRIAVYYNPDSPSESCPASRKNSIGVRRFISTALVAIAIVAGVILIPLIILAVLH